ncbi:MAG TPA: hypothetical protein P5205_17465 [Candidatus Paceibacterota bacterium]|nr:hypothetical protein [Candidatus Paceibacterota bacterium]
MLGEPKNQCCLTRAALRRGGRARSKCLLPLDRIQGAGSLPDLAWFGSAGVSSTSFPFANHRGAGGNSIGGNFVYEDGSVLRREFGVAGHMATINIGTAVGWTVSYRPADFGPVPW